MNPSIEKNDKDPLSLWIEGAKENALALRNLMLFRSHPDDIGSREEIEPRLAHVAEMLSSCERDLDEAQRYLDSEKAHIATMRDFHRVVAHRKARVALIQEQLPPHLKATLSTSKSDFARDAIGTNKPKPDLVDETPVIALSPLADGDSLQQRQSSRQTPKAVPGALATAVASTSKPKSTTTKLRKTKSKESTQSQSGPLVRAATESELREAPQYVKGRLTVEKVAAVAAKLSEIGAAKYALLKRPNSSLTTDERTQCGDFADAQIDETQGRKFLTDVEIKGFGQYRIDATVKSALNVLRHIGVLKEIRGKNKAKVFIIN